MSTKYNVIFGINKNEPELAEAINARNQGHLEGLPERQDHGQIRLGDKAWFVPPEKNPRIGVDRDADYKAPTADHCF